MNINLNDKPANITLDTEKTLGDVLTGIELWIAPTGNRIQRISIDGQTVETEKLEEYFNMDVKNIKKLDVFLSSWRELASEAFDYLEQICSAYTNAAFDERAQLAADWQQSAAARFLQSDIADMHELAAHTLSGEGFSPQELSILVQERLREITDPALEMDNCEILIKDIARRMEELPLDMQTGKDQRAAETIQLFSKTSEKLFRIFFIHKTEGLSLDAFVIDELPARAFIEEFNTAIDEISAAYENRDTVLVGDLSEYELAPRLLKFFSALKGFSDTISRGSR